jgi:glycosyltransferase involved in cell wall biosynthesis
VPLPSIAYLTALYPAISHTFIMREIAALRALGFEVETCSMRRPGAAHLNSPEDHSAADTTFYAVETGKNPLSMMAAFGTAFTRPARFLATLGLAFRTAPPGLKGALKQTAYLAEAMVLARHLKARNVTHLHNHFADPSANVAMLTSSLSGIPFSYTLHGPAELYEPEKWQLREKTARATFVACISHFCRAQAMYFSEPDDWSKLHIIHCGVIPETYETPNDRVDLPNAGLRLVFVGRLTPIKGVRILLASFSDALKRNPDLRLTLVGDGDDRAALETLAAPLADAVQFTGALNQTDVAQALAQADALVLPSFAEGLPVVLMEAMAAGKPVICTQVAGVRELVEDGVSGYVVPAGDSESLTDRINALANATPDMRAKMGLAGRAKVKAEFDIRREAARIGSLFAAKDPQGIRPDPYEPSD